MSKLADDNTADDESVDNPVLAARDALVRSGIEDNPVLGTTDIAIYLYNWGYQVRAKTADGTMKNYPSRDLDAVEMGEFLQFRALVSNKGRVVVRRDTDRIEVAVVEPGGRDG